MTMFDKLNDLDEIVRELGFDPDRLREMRGTRRSASVSTTVTRKSKPELLLGGRSFFL
jgi:hypothetical protein